MYWRIFSIISSKISSKCLVHNWARQFSLHISTSEMNNSCQWLSNITTHTMHQTDYSTYLLDSFLHRVLFFRKVFCPYCIGRLNENLNIPRKKAATKFLVQKIEEWIRKIRRDILLRSSIQFPNLFAVVRIKFSLFQCDVKWSSKIGLDFQLKNLFIFPFKTFKFQQSN